MLNTIFKYIDLWRLWQMSRVIEDHYGLERGGYYQRVIQLIDDGILPRSLIMETVQLRVKRIQRCRVLREIENDFVGSDIPTASRVVDCCTYLMEEI